MDYSDTLLEAARQFDGGARSFPPNQDATLARQYAYQPPNKDYDRFFFSNVGGRLSTYGSPTPPRSAGWLMAGSDDPSICKPVFIAHSTLAAIWLLRETLGDAALSNDGWRDLVRAARTHMGETGGSRSLTRSPPETSRSQSLFHAHEDHTSVPPSAQVTYGQLPATQQSATPTARTSSSKQARVDVAEVTSRSRGDISSPNPSVEDPNDEGLGPVAHTTTVTNNNRRAEQTRARKRDALHAKKRITLGLQRPDLKAPMQERAAYDAILPKDEATVAWIIKQNVSDDVDFYTTSPTPYFTACSILQKARSLGNQSSRHYAAQFLHAWRERGTPFQAGNEEIHSLQPPPPQQDIASSLSQRRNTDEAFRFAWKMCGQYETALAAVHISARWALALLGQAYAQKVQLLQDSDFVASNDRTRNRYGRGQVRTQAITALRDLIYPGQVNRDYDVFRYRLRQAARWHKVVQSLGWGSLLLIPHEEVSNRWLERVLRVGQLDVFLALVQRERPDLCAASRALEAWLGPDGIAGAPISGKQRLSIETEAPATVYEIEEIQDSEDEVDSDEENNMLDILRSPVSEPSPKSPPSLRQTTLLELFHPVKLPH